MFTPDAGDDRPGRPVSGPDATGRPETVWTMRPPALRFGRGATAELPAELRTQGVVPPATVLVVTDPTLRDGGHADAVRTGLDDAGYETALHVTPDAEPSAESVAAAADAAREEAFDAHVAVGGGSVLDTAKAGRVVAASGGAPTDYVAPPAGAGGTPTASGPPLVALPTTAGTGAEISSVAVFSVPDRPVKVGLSHPLVGADAAVLDPVLTRSLPPDLTAATAMDALGHAIETYTTLRYDALARPADPADRPGYAGRTGFGAACSRRAVDLVAGNVRRAVHNGDDLDARAALLEGAALSSIAGLTAGAGLCHAMAYPVGARYDAHHGATVAALTPASTLGHVAGAGPGRIADLAPAFGVADAGDDRAVADRVREAHVRLQRDLGVLPSGLADLGVEPADLDALARLTVETGERLLACSPRPADADEIRAVYEDALHNW
jgi:alcohol dehydrogenase class IV